MPFRPLSAFSLDAINKKFKDLYNAMRGLSNQVESAGGADPNYAQFGTVTKLGDVTGLNNGTLLTIDEDNQTIAFEVDGNVTVNGSPVKTGVNYLVYTALLTQTGTSAPVATVLENTLGGAIVWSRTGDGSYIGTLSGAFTEDKTHINGFGDWGDSGNPYMPISDGATIVGYYTIYRLNANSVNLQIIDATFSFVDLSVLIGNGVLNLPEIRVYP